MGFINSPPDAQPSTFKETALRQLKALFLQIFRRSQGFLDAQKLPYAANKVCQCTSVKQIPSV